MEIYNKRIVTDNTIHLFFTISNISAIKENNNIHL